MNEEETPSALRHYIDHKIFHEKTFKHDGEITNTLAFFDAVQRRMGIRGHVAEIGVASGSFFIPLALCCRPGERALAIDVFDDLSSNWNPHGGVSSLEDLKSTVSAIADGLDSHIRYLSGDSFFLAPDDLVSTVGGGKFRLFSIDGAHSSHHTINDLRIADSVIAPGGIVLLDDIKNWGWPGVIEAFARYMMQPGRLVPFFLYGNKLLLTTPDAHSPYLKATVELAHNYNRVNEVSYRISRFFGYDTLGWN